MDQWSTASMDQDTENQMKLNHYRMICAFESKDWKSAVAILVDQFKLTGISQVQLEHYPVVRFPGYREIFLTLPGHQGYSWMPEDSFISEICGPVACPTVSLWYPSLVRHSEILDL